MSNARKSFAPLKNFFPASTENILNLEKKGFSDKGHF